MWREGRKKLGILIFDIICFLAFLPVIQGCSKDAHFKTDLHKYFSF